MPSSFLRLSLPTHAAHVVLTLCLGVAVLVVPTPAFADDAATTHRVEELKKRGNQAMMDLNYADALDAYSAAIAIAPDDASLYYNLGRAHQAREDYPAALDALDRFGQKASPEMRARVPKLDQLVGDVRSRVATVAVRCSADVQDASVTIAEKTTLKGCSTAPKQVRIGVPTHSAVVEVRLTAESFQSQSVRVSVEGGGPPVPVMLTLLAKASSGTLLVRASPPDAHISIDGIERGNPPLEVPLAAGAHEVDVRADRHDPAHVPVVVVAGRTKDVSVELQRSASLTSKWWFWTGVGVVVVGVGVWYLVAQPESTASSGSIPPGQVSAPLVRF